MSAALAEATVAACAALAANPTDPGARDVLGRLVGDPASHDGAVAALSLSADPRKVAALGLLAQIAGAQDAARDQYRKALMLDPAEPTALRGFVSIAVSPADKAEAEALLRAAIAARPGHATALADLGALLFRAGRAEEAAPVLADALAAAPAAANTARLLFAIHQERGCVQAAHDVHVAHLGRLRDPIAELNAATLLPPIPDSEDHALEWRARFAAAVARLADDPPPLPEPGRAFARSLFLLAYHGLDDRRIREDLARLYRGACPALDFTAEHCRARRPAPARIRLAVVSAFCREHTIGKLNLGLVERLPRDRFETVVFAVPGRADAMTERWRKAAERFVSLPADLWQAQRTIAETAPDALFYPEIGMDGFAYLLAFARLAPVQFTTWGHPETSGLRTIDTFLSSRWIEPDGAAAHYSERLVPLDALPARPYKAAAPALPGRAELGLPAEARVYTCPQTLVKFHPRFDPMLAEILARDPQGILVLIAAGPPNWRELLSRRFARAGIDTRRVRFLPPLPLAGFLGLYRAADAVLDTPIFCGGISSYEALCLGVPVITLAGDFMRGRLTAGMYAKMGLGDFAAGDAASYVGRALCTAGDRDFREAWRTRIAERVDSLYETDDSVRDFAAFVESAVRG